MIVVLLSGSGPYTHANEIVADRSWWFVPDRLARLVTAPSPLLVVFALGFALYIWASCGLRRAITLVARPMDLRAGVLALLVREKKDICESLEQGFGTRLSTLPLKRLFLAAAIVVGLPAIVVGRRFLPTLEGFAADLILFSMLVLVYVLVGMALVRLAWMWIKLSASLRELDWLPLIYAFDRLSKRFSSAIGDQIYAVGPRQQEYEPAESEQREIQAALSKIAGSGVPAPAAKEKFVRASSRTWKTITPLVEYLKKSWDEYPVEAAWPEP